MYTKKKELVGPFKQGGREWWPKGQPEEVRGRGFLVVHQVVAADLREMFYAGD